MYSALKTVSAYHAAAFFAVVLCAYIMLRKRRIQRLINPRGLPYPPGPKPRPVIGNMLDLAAENEAVVYQHLAEKYGKSLSSLYSILTFIRILIIVSLE